LCGLPSSAVHTAHACSTWGVPPHQARAQAARQSLGVGLRSVNVSSSSSSGPRQTAFDLCSLREVAVCVGASASALHVQLSMRASSVRCVLGVPQAAAEHALATASPAARCPPRACPWCAAP
jgi:hypothetical protein